MNRKGNRHTTPAPWEKGFVTVTAFILIVIFCSLVFGLTPLLRAGAEIPEKMRAHFSEEERLNLTAENVLQKLSEQQRPAVDSPHALFMEDFASTAREGSVSIELTDISSSINLNTFRDEILLSEGNPHPLSDLLLQHRSDARFLEQERADNGFYTNRKKPESRLPGLFKKGAVEKYTTVHGYWNINISDEKSLEQIYALRTGDKARAEIFRGRIREARAAELIFSNDSLTGVMPCHHQLLYPAINAVPLLNVNFLPEEILRSVLHHDFGSRLLPEPEESLETLLSRRKNTFIESDQLPGIFGINDENHPVFAYLGVRTWFWNITITSSKAELQLDLAVIPDPDSSYTPGEPVHRLREETLRIIGRTFTLKEEEE